MKKEFIPVQCDKFACQFYNNCCHCATEIVRFRDDWNIDLMFVGQGAGAEEDQRGKPFQGRAGKLLRTKLKPIIESEKLNIILDNTIRSRPLDENGKNRAPTEKELEFCIDYLWDRIQTYKPKVIVTLGASATGSMIPALKGKPISSSRGKVVEYNGQTFLPTFHPAAVLHCPEEEKRISIEQAMCTDFAMAVNLVKSNTNLL